MIFDWLNEEECEVRHTEGGDVVLALRFDNTYMRWETQSWPNDFMTPDDLWEEIDLGDAPVRSKLRSVLEAAAAAPEGGVRDVAMFEYKRQLGELRNESKDLAVQAATRRAKAALRDR